MTLLGLGSTTRMASSLVRKGASRDLESAGEGKDEEGRGEDREGEGVLIGEEGFNGAGGEDREGGKEARGAGERQKGKRWASRGRGEQGVDGGREKPVEDGLGGADEGQRGAGYKWARGRVACEDPIGREPWRGGRVVGSRKGTAANRRRIRKRVHRFVDDDMALGCRRRLVEMRARINESGRGIRGAKRRNDRRRRRLGRGKAAICRPKRRLVGIEEYGRHVGEHASTLGQGVGDARQVPREGVRLAMARWTVEETRRPARARDLDPTAGIGKGYGRWSHRVEKRRVRRRCLLPGVRHPQKMSIRL
ncbi:hypothetical protein AMTR_s00007p00096510 [Amborella trichopoda]|uniref:Uncharacterized protein n=1 Tax=Amborella trichopoda TaxID=13333 RepID=W1PC31_AMBTC|nr:hypothetical protein AMTR_s00007p00096510 [Amborella trichopoda]